MRCLEWMVVGVLLFQGCSDDRRRAVIDVGVDRDVVEAEVDASVPVDGSSDGPTSDGPTRDGPASDEGSTGPVVCTPETASSRCGGRPCVDGYCCNSECAGACEACDLPSQEGTCSMRAVGSACDDGNEGTFGDMCVADGSCAGTAGCATPTDACADGTQSREGCGGARVIGRASAATASGFTGNGDTCGGRNRFDDCSWDAGNDHAYRIWLRTGEQIAVQVDLRDSCFSDFDATLKLFESTGCTDVTCGTDLWCEDFVEERVPFNYTAVRDGWIVVVVDGSTAFDDEGIYAINVRLTGCATADCGCF